MSGGSQQIVTLYEDCGMSIEEIAQAGHGDVLAIKAVLTQFSGKYREMMSGEKKVLDFTDEDLDQVNAVIRNAAMYAEDEHLRFRAAKYIRDDKKQRLDGVKGLKSLNINLNAFMLHLNKAKELTSKKEKVIELQTAT